MAFKFIEVLEEFADAGEVAKCFDNIGFRDGDPRVWRQWTSPDVYQAAEITKNAIRARERYQNDPHARAAQAARHRERMLTDPDYAERRRENERRRKRGMRERMPELREGLTCKFEIFTRDGNTVDGYVTTGCYPDGRLGEVFVKVGKVGDESALLDQWAIAVSTALQYGAPLDDFIRKFVGTRFEPSGSTKTREVPRCTSPLDFVARWLLHKYGKREGAEGEVK